MSQATVSLLEAMHNLIHTAETHYGPRAEIQTIQVSYEIFLDIITYSKEVTEVDTSIPSSCTLWIGGRPVQVVTG